MSEHEIARPSRAGVPLSQFADGVNQKDPKYWATEHDGIKYVRQFNGRFYKEKANDVKHSGAFLLPDGRSAVIINANNPHKWHWPKTAIEKKMADDAMRQYWAKYQFAPSKHYEFREKKHKEGAWVKPGTPGSFGYTHATPPPPAAARTNHGNRAPPPQPAVHGHVIRAGPPRQVPQDYVHAPPPAVNAWSRRGNSQQAHQQQGQAGAANHAQPQSQQMAGFNKYMQFDLRTFKIISRDPLIRACAEHVNILKRDFEAWSKKGEALQKIKDDLGVNEGKPLKFKFELPVVLIKKLAEYKTNFESCQQQFAGKKYLYKFPPFLELVSDMKAEVIRAGHKPLLEDAGMDATCNFVLKFVYDFVERHGTENEKMIITDELAPFYFKTAANFYEYICRDLAILLVHHHDEMEQLRIKRQTAEIMDQQSGATSHGDVDAAAQAYKERRDEETDPPKALRNHDQQVEFFLFCMRNSNLDRKFKVPRMIYELIHTARIDYEWFEIINTNSSSFREAYERYTKPLVGYGPAQSSGRPIFRHVVNTDHSISTERLET